MPQAIRTATSTSTSTATGLPCGFAGFAPAVFEWFAGLERDNSKLYFATTRELYETEVRGALEGMLDKLSESFGGEVKMFRQHRDVRFSADKSPYKTSTYGLLTGNPATGAGLYAALSSGGLYAGTGYYQMAPDQLERFRDAVNDDAGGTHLTHAVRAAERGRLELAGATLRTAPRGYRRDHPRIDLLRRKAIIAGRALPGAHGVTSGAALEHVASTWCSATPLNAWLERYVGPSSTGSGPTTR